MVYHNTSILGKLQHIEMLSHGIKYGLRISIITLSLFGQMFRRVIYPPTPHIYLREEKNVCLI